MTDTKISALGAVTTPALGDEFPTNQAGVTKKETNQQMSNLLGSMKFRLTADHTLSSATATEMTDLKATAVPAGAWLAEYFLLAQAAVAATTGIRFGLNFSGTAAVRHMWLQYPGSGTAANTGIADDVGANTGQLTESNPQTAFSTTAPNMGITGVTTINTPILMIINALLVVTASGDLSIWHGSSGAVASTVKAGSVMRLTTWP